MRASTPWGWALVGLGLLISTFALHAIHPAINVFFVGVIFLLLGLDAAHDIRKCSFCGHLNPSRAKNCETCGRKIPERGRS